jgi:hypothetical protein
MKEQNEKYENIKKGQLKGLAIGVTIAGIIVLGIVLRLLETVFKKTAFVTFLACCF